MKAILRSLHRKSEDNTFFWRVLVLVIITSMLLSLMIGLKQSVWFDEAYSIMLARQPVDKLLTFTAIDTHPPLYYLVLKVWGSLFGWSDIALRALSVLCYGGAISMMALVIRSLFGNRAAVSSLLFMVIAPFAMRYGFEIRMYSMAMLIGATATYVLVRATHARAGDARQWWIVYAVLVALGVYTLYYTALLWIAHLVWLVLRSGRMRPGAWLRQPWALAYAGSIVLFLPWLPQFLKQLNNGALAPIAQSMTLEHMLGILTFNFLSQPLGQLGALVSVLALFIVVVVPTVLTRAYMMTKQRDGFLLILLYILVPIVLLTLIGFNRPMYVERYLSHLALALMALVGASVYIVDHHRPSRLLKTSATLLLLVVLVGFAHLVQIGNYNFQRMQRPNMNEVASALRPKCEAGDAIVAADPYVDIELEALLPNCVVTFYSDTPNLKGGYAMLANSPRRVDNPVPKLQNTSIQYVYYDQPKLTFDEGYQQTGRQVFGPVTVASLSAE